jgi:small GTP-binding protein
MRTAKVVCVGESGVGKTSLVKRLAHDTFDKFESSTIGAAYASIKREYGDGEKVSFQWWDTCGQERYAALVPMYYRGSSVVLVCVDKNTSEEKRRYWTGDARRYCDNVVIVGMKCELDGNESVESVDLQTSAATSEGCEELLEHISQYATEPKPPSSLDVHSSAPPKTGYSCCWRR